MRRLLFTLMSMAACAVASTATVYKWVDENGVVHYSDQPHENAEKVQIAAPQTYKSQPVYNNPQADRNARHGPNVYGSCAVTSPTNDQNFPNADSISVSVLVSPAPHDGDQALLLMDGARVPNFPAAGGSVTISSVDRGEHSLQAVVQDSNGKVLCQSAAVTFSITQPSVLNPNNPIKPH
jgi:hypothetical protein